MELGKHIEGILAHIARDVADRVHWIEPVSDEDRAAHAQFMSRGIRFEAAALEGFLSIDAEAYRGCSL